MTASFPVPADKEQFADATRRLSTEVDLLWGPLGGILGYTQELPAPLAEEIREASKLLADLDRKIAGIADVAKWAVS